MIIGRYSFERLCMTLLVQITIGLVLIIHLYVLWLEMFAWTSHGWKIFKGYPKAFFETTKVLAANQGLYNGFLAAGLLWSYFIPDHVGQQFVRYFFLGCVAVAGIYGALTADRKIFFFQAVPALVALTLIFLSS
jgi:putative membrane protein